MTPAVSKSNHLVRSNFVGIFLDDNQHSGAHRYRCIKSAAALAFGRYKMNPCKYTCLIIFHLVAKKLEQLLNCLIAFLRTSTFLGFLLRMDLIKRRMAEGT